jgi:hypothetical protein
MQLRVSDHFRSHKHFTIRQKRFLYNDFLLTLSPYFFTAPSLSCFEIRPLPFLESSGELLFSPAFIPKAETINYRAQATNFLSPAPPIRPAKPLLYNIPPLAYYALQVFRSQSGYSSCT